MNGPRGWVQLHTYAAAVNSSMVFGFNLFLPFRVVGSASLAELLSTATGLALRVERVHFEYGPSAILAETRSDPAGLDEHRTSADIGIEVKRSPARALERHVRPDGGRRRQDHPQNQFDVTRVLAMCEQVLRLNVDRRDQVVVFEDAEEGALVVGRVRALG